MNTIIEKSTYEIERGKPMPSKNHAIIQSKLIKVIFVKYPHEFEVLSELSLDLGDRNRVPDLAIYKEINYTPGEDEIHVTKMPLGVIEILSPMQSNVELILKSNEYFDAGVQSYWLVMPNLKSIYVFSGKREYEVFAKTDLLKDTKLDIELDLGLVFK